MHHKRLFEPQWTTVTIPSEGFVRLPIALLMIPVGKSTWYEGVKSGRYPKQYKISGDGSGWDVNELRACMAEIKKQRD